MLPKLTLFSLFSSLAFGQVKYAGVNIAGFDFGCSTDGTCDVDNTVTTPNSDGQMQHFADADGLNLFRLPVAWQYLVTDLGGSLNQTSLATYNTLVQTCLDTGSHCIIDIHNYARWNGEIIGQGGPTNAQFASLWSQLATYYSNSSNVIFGVMNEPHDIPDITTWAGTVQAAVTAIRSAGATSQMILLPGNDWTHAQTLISDGSAAALSNVTNPDGTNTSLIFDVHQYLDSDGSGTSTECTTDHVSDAFEPLAAWLRANNRLAILSETGGGNTNSCLTDLCATLTYLNSNNDVYLGYTGWSAGGFDSTYALTETPTKSSNGSFTDQAIVSQCIVGTRSGYDGTSSYSNRSGLRRRMASSRRVR